MMLSGCNGDVTFTVIDTPAAAGSAEPHLFAAANGKVFLSWIEPGETASHRLAFSSSQNGSWTEPRPIAEGSNWFVNWADFPSITALSDSHLVAHYLVKSGSATYSYDVNIVQSYDGGASWSAARVPHTDQTQTEHGFVSIVPWSSDSFFSIWLDGRHMLENEQGVRGAMTLRSARLDQNFRLSDEHEIDDMTCECCQTAAVKTQDGLLAVYRNRSESEIRDIYAARFNGVSWTAPYPVHVDQWEIAGCPVNGPSLDATDNLVALAWFTGEGESPRVLTTFSTDGGATFLPPLQLNTDMTVGRVDIALHHSGSALVSWLEDDADQTFIKASIIHMEDSTVISGPVHNVAVSDAARRAGFPRMVIQEETVYWAWTAVDEEGNTAVQTAIAPYALYE